MASEIATNSDAAKVLTLLRQLGVDWALTDEGDLMIRYWQLGAEQFVPKEYVSHLRGLEAPSAAPTSSLEWLSKNLAALKTQYSGEWIAVSSGSVMAHAPTLSVLLAALGEVGEDAPFITQIPDASVVWSTTYAG